MRRGNIHGTAALALSDPPVAEQPDGTLLVHALDTGTPVADQFAAEEARFAAAFPEVVRLG